MKYEKYKDSGIKWIGEIPERWEVIKFKYFADLFIGNSIPDEDKKNFELVEEGIPYIATKDVKADYSVDYENGMYIPANSSNFKIATERSVLMCIEGGSAGIKKCFLERNVCFGNKLCCFRPTAKYVNARYMYYFIMSPTYERYFHLNLSGLIGGVSIQNLKNFESIIPPINEQEIIASYLDDKTSKIDAIIKSLEEQRDKLEQYKRELIAETVTGGLDKNVPMKHSGVDWIGEIPAHWRVEKIKWNFEIVKRQDGRENRPVLSITQNGIKIKDIEKNDGQMAESYENYQLVEIGDYAMNSMDLLTGWVDCSKYEGVTSPDYRVFRLQKPEDNSRPFFNYLFQMCYTRRIFYRLGQGVSNLGRWRLQREPFLNMMIPIPPKGEQNRIANYIKVKDAQVRRITRKIDLQIEELREYRKIIIHEAVTGKRKVVGGAE